MLTESVNISEKQARLIFQALKHYEQEGEAFLNGWTILPKEEGGALDIELYLETHTDLVEIAEIKNTLKDVFQIVDNDENQ